MIRLPLPECSSLAVKLLFCNHGNKSVITHFRCLQVFKDLWCCWAGLYSRSFWEWTRLLVCHYEQLLKFLWCFGFFFSTQWWPCSPALKSLWAEYFKLQWKAMRYSSALWISFRFYVCFICPRISRKQVSTDHATVFSELSNYFWTLGGGFNILFCFLSYFYLTQNDIQKILSEENVCVWALVIYTN